jgi:hypothetical protein
MKKCVASAPDAEIAGRALECLKTSILHTEFEKLLEKYGLGTIEPDGWYPQQAVLNVHHDILSGPNGQEIEVSIGIRIIDGMYVFFPEGIDISGALQVFSDSHTQIQRNISDDDLFIFRSAGKRHIEIINSSPFPDALVYGYVYSLMKRYCPPSSSPMLKYRDPSKIDSDQSMIFDLTWSSKSA